MNPFFCRSISWARAHRQFTNESQSMAEVDALSTSYANIVPHARHSTVSLEFFGVSIYLVFESFHVAHDLLSIVKCTQYMEQIARRLGTI